MAGSLSDILRRFRPTAAPGPAAPAGVPVDRATERADELAPVFVALEPTFVAVDAIADAARTEAEQRRRAAAIEAERILADARSRLDAARAEAAAAATAATERERTAAEAAADEQIDRIRAHTTERMPGLVDRVMAMVRATGQTAGEAAATGSGRPGAAA